MEPIITENEYWGLFEISLVIKGLNALADLAGGIIIWFTSKVVLVTFILNFFQNDLSDNPKDYIANFIVNSAETLAVSSQYFLAAYLLIHGIVKIFLLVCLYKRKLWAYPTSIIIFSLLIFYESYTFYLNNSMLILIFTILDIILVLLTGHEYGVLKKKLKNSKK
jgi:uncharacterized membrane protein